MPVSQEPRTKRVKTEPGAREDLAAKLKSLQQQLEQAQTEMASMPPQLKREGPDDDDGFRVMVNAFSKETSNKPVLIDDSP